MLINEISHFLERIQAHIRSHQDHEFLTGFKSALKPDSTLPIIWVLIYRDILIFCCTHKTRGIYKIIKREEIDSFKLDSRNNRLVLLHKELNKEDFNIPLSPKFDPTPLINELKKLGYQIL